MTQFDEFDNTFRSMNDKINLTQGEQQEILKQINNRMNTYSQENKKPVSHKRYYVALASTALILLLLAMPFITNYQQASQKMISSYPEEIQNKINELPKEFRRNMEVPLELPEPYSVIDFGYNSNPIGDPNGNIHLTTFIFAIGDLGYHLVFNTYYGENNIEIDNSSSITLNNDNTAVKKGDYELMWESKNGQIHKLSLMVPPDTTDTGFTIDDLIKIANSVE